MYIHISTFYKVYKALTNHETSLPLSCSGELPKGCTSHVGRNGTEIMERKIQNIKSGLHRKKSYWKINIPKNNGYCIIINNQHKLYYLINALRHLNKRSMQKYCKAWLNEDLAWIIKEKLQEVYWSTQT